MLRFCDSFDHYGTGFALVSKKWTNSVDDTFGQTGVTTGRFGNGIAFNADSQRVYKLLGDAHDTWILGVAVVPTGLGAYLHLYDAGSSQLYVYRNSSALLEVRRGDGTVLGTGTTVLNTGVWSFIELKAVIHNSTGAAEIRLNGAVELTLTGVDTQNTANASANGVGLGKTGGGGGQTYWDDFYALDGDDSGIAGAPNDDYLGDVRVEALYPNGNGASSDFIGQDSNSTDNYLNVDEATPDDDTTYNESGTPTDKDTYAMTSLTPTSGEVFGIQLLAYAKKTDAGTRTLDLVARESGGTEENSSAFTLSTTYQYFLDARDGDPDAAQWTIASVNAAEAGVEVG